MIQLQAEKVLTRFRGPNRGPKGRVGCGRLYSGRRLIWPFGAAELAAVARAPRLADRALVRLALVPSPRGGVGTAPHCAAVAGRLREFGQLQAARQRRVGGYGAPAPAQGRGCRMSGRRRGSAQDCCRHQARRDTVSTIFVSSPAPHNPIYATARGLPPWGSASAGA